MMFLQEHQQELLSAAAANACAAKEIGSSLENQLQQVLCIVCCLFNTGLSRCFR
jgi:GH24 family phage-related lysozyme (muramidase)